MQCLHCEISELLMRRERQGHHVGPNEIGKICEVIADIAASVGGDASGVFRIARDHLAQFEHLIAKGEYQADRELFGSGGRIKGA